jgi:basic amino acid/polyamine antiporter, APA family
LNVAIVAYHEHHAFHGLNHMVVPVFGLVANLVCLLFYLIGPCSVAGMSWKEPYIALGIAAVWGIYGAIYFTSASRKKDKPVLVEVTKAACFQCSQAVVDSIFSSQIGQIFYKSCT